MQQLHLLFVFLYIVFNLLFLLFLGFAIRAEKGFSVFKQNISALGLKSHPHHKKLNNLLILLGFSTLMFSQIVINYLPFSVYANTGVFCIAGAGIFTVLSGFIPFDIKPFLHNVFAFSLFFLSLIASLVLIPVFLSTYWIPDFIVSLNILAIGFSLPLIYGSIILHFTKRSIKNIWFYEWLAMGSAMMILLSVSVFLVLYLLNVK